MSVLAWILAAMILWELVALYLKCLARDPMAEKKLPDLLSVAETFRDYGLIVLRQAGVTFSYAVCGFAIGAGAGFLIAVVMHRFQIVEKICFPYLLASQMIPILGLAPIIIGLCRDIDAARIVISAYMSFFPVAVSFLGGLKSVPAEYLQLLRSCGAGQPAVFGKLLIPWALPSLFSSLKIAAPVSISAAILVDTLSAKDGIGYVIIYTLYGGGTVGQFWPAILVASLMGVISFLLISWIESVVLKRFHRKEGRTIAA
ncbi:MAG: ABC transporter permease subunit [Firmicutes bacterium]|nr:ABC transporter permease subunit [Bacillota bacterium]